MGKEKKAEEFKGGGFGSAGVSSKRGEGTSEDLQLRSWKGVRGGRRDLCPCLAALSMEEDKLLGSDVLVLCDEEAIDVVEVEDCAARDLVLDPVLQLLCCQESVIV